MDKSLLPGTQLIHSGQPAQGEPFARGPVFASTFLTAGDPSKTDYQYGRYGNPNWTDLEDTLGRLEEGVARVFPSGAGAISAMMFALCEPGQTIILPSDAYFGTRSFATNWMQRWGLKIRFVRTVEMHEADYTDVRLAVIESPSNPGLDVCDIQQVVRRAHAAGALVAVDNTTATPLGQRPLQLGADISISSDSKMLNGHSDVIFGHLASRDEQLIEAISDFRSMSGSIPGPMETWLVRRGIATLDMRHERQTKNAKTIAEFLLNHPKVGRVRYPGLEGDPAHAIASKQMIGFGCVLTFELASQDAAEAFFSDEGLIYEATSFGGLHSMAERRARWQGETAPPNLIRLSVGCEPLTDLLAQLKKKFELIG